MIENPTRDDFAACIGTSFRLCPYHPQGFDLLVENVSAVETYAEQESFSVFFRGPADRGVPQATYPLVHDCLGSMELFLVPIARDERGFLYEAVFNRLLTA